VSPGGVETPPPPALGSVFCVSPKLRLISWDSYSPLPSRLFPPLWRFPFDLPRLKLAASDLRRCQLFVHHGKGAKNRVVYLSDHAYEALTRIIR